jgi:hypothetical protein
MVDLRSSVVSFQYGIPLVYLYTGQEGFPPQLQGCFGWFKPRVVGMSVADAEGLFWERYDARFTGVPGRRLKSPQGREYVRLHLEEWCGR